MKKSVIKKSFSKGKKKNAGEEGGVKSEKINSPFPFGVLRGGCEN